MTRNTALGVITALLLGLMGSVVGGWMASGEPMNFTHHRTQPDPFGPALILCHSTDHLFNTRRKGPYHEGCIRLHYRLADGRTNDRACHSLAIRRWPLIGLEYLGTQDLHLAQRLA